MTSCQNLYHGSWNSPLSLQVPLIIPPDLSKAGTHSMVLTDSIYVHILLSKLPSKLRGQASGTAIAMALWLLLLSSDFLSRNPPTLLLLKIKMTPRPNGFHPTLKSPLEVEA
jgi:hypothetical protein